MQVALLVAAVVILAGVVLAALGRAGEMATFASDTPPMEIDEVSATDVALLRPPMSLWGYNAHATEDALRVIARSVTARDVEIASLRREVADLRGGAGGAKATGAAASQPADPVAAYRRPILPAASQPADPVAAYRPPAPAAPSEPPATVAASLPPAPAAPSEPPATAAASEPPATAAASEPRATAAASEPPDPGAETQPAGQTPHAEPPGQADPPTEDDWRPIWQRSPGPGPDD